jgi:hypothetical protein
MDAFYAAHAAGGPGNVVLALAQPIIADHGERIGVFSTIAKARAWADTLSEDEFAGVVFSPYVIDVPEYGNVPKGERQ